MTEELKPCPAGHLQEFLDALNGGMGDLDAWLECNNEDEVRIAIHGVIAAESAEVERLREENKRLRHIMSHIDGKIVMQARSAAGYAMHIHTLQNAAPLPKWPEES